MVGSGGGDKVAHQSYQVAVRGCRCWLKKNVSEGKSLQRGTHFWVEYRGSIDVGRTPYNL